MLTIILFAAFVALLLIIITQVKNYFTQRTVTERVEKELKKYSVGEPVKETPKLPHEIFPELLFWQKGDDLTRYVSYHSYKAKYLGVKDNVVYVKHENDDAVKALTAEEASKYSNYTARKMMNQFEEKKVLAEIEGDSYNEFLGVMREETLKFMADEPAKALAATNE